MKNPTISRVLSANSRLKVPINDLVLLIDELVNPALLIDTQTKEIYCGNDAFIQITGIGNAELMHMQVDQLFQETASLDVDQYGNRNQGILFAKNKVKIPVSFTEKSLQESGRLALLSISSETNNFPTEESLSNLNEVIQEILRVGLKGGLDEVIDATIHATKLFFGINHVAVYRLEKEMLTLQIQDKKFPEQLPKIELERINNLDVWFPGKRILCEVHRIGRKNGFPVLVTNPIRSDHFFGLIVMGMDSVDIFNDQHLSIEIFFAWINQIIDLAIVVQQTKSEKISLQNYNNAYLSFVELSDDILLILNDNDVIEYASNNFFHLMHYAMYEVINKNVNDLLNCEEIQAIIENPTALDDRRNQTVELLDRDGNSHSMILRVDFIQTEGGVKKVLIISDKTSFIRMERSIANYAKQASLGESIADFAHDVRNPLNNISTGLQMVRKVYQENEPLIEAVDRMQSDCIRMTDLIESVLSFARQDVEKFTTVDLAQLIANVYKRFEKKFDRKKIVANFSQMVESANILGDYRSLERIFINLINNSLESMEDAGGELSVLIKNHITNQQEIEVSIADTGPGIPKEILERIFDPYVSGKKTGTGLGLSITKRLVDAHQGRIDVDSFTSGTIFRIFFNKDLEEK